MNPVKAFNILLAYKKVFDELGVTFWLDGGTCLGAYRDNSFTPTDFDVDVGISFSNQATVGRIIERLREEGFGHIHHKRHPSGIGQQISSVKDGIPSDVFIYFRRGDKVFRIMFDITPLKTVRFIPVVYPSYIFDTFSNVDFMDYGVLFNVVSCTSEYLELSYGNWQVDRSDFHWQADYKCMDMNFDFAPKPKGKRLWLKTDTIKFNQQDGEFFKPLVKEGYKLFPIEVDSTRNCIDGNKRLSAYVQLGVPMVECYVT